MPQPRASHHLPSTKPSSRALIRLRRKSRRQNRVNRPLLYGLIEYLYGINPVLASLSARRRTFDKLYLSITEKGEGRRSSPKIEQIYKMASSYGLKVKYLHKVRV